MTKEEMKNRISMALKDPVLQQGFEIICKNIAELEKENAELKKTVIKMNNVITETFSTLTKAKELLMCCKKYHFHSEVTEYPYNEVEAFLKEVSE